MALGEVMTPEEVLKNYHKYQKIYVNSNNSKWLINGKTYNRPITIKEFNDNFNGEASKWVGDVAVKRGPLREQSSSKTMGRRSDRTKQARRIRRQEEATQVPPQPFTEVAEKPIDLIEMIAVELTDELIEARLKREVKKYTTKHCIARGRDRLFRGYRKQAEESLEQAQRDLDIATKNSKRAKARRKKESEKRKLKKKKKTQAKQDDDLESLITISNAPPTTSSNGNDTNATLSSMGMDEQGHSESNSDSNETDNAIVEPSPAKPRATPEESDRWTANLRKAAFKQAQEKMRERTES
jgi:hypothetical protein